LPPIIEVAEFEPVQPLLKTRSPALTAPRIVSGPTLLTGICFCAACRMAMTLRTGAAQSGWRSSPFREWSRGWKPPSQRGPEKVERDRRAAFEARDWNRLRVIQNRELRRLGLIPETRGRPRQHTPEMRKFLAQQDRLLKKHMADEKARGGRSNPAQKVLERYRQARRLDPR
jgi:hypothetical protein